MARRAGTLTLRREDGRIICDSVTVNDSTRRRMWGLLGRRALPSGEGVVLRPAWSIHTAFMRFSIDVVFIDAELVVMRIDEDLRPFKTASCRGAREVVELPAGECARRGLAVGDRVAWAARNVVNEIALAESPTLGLERKGTVLVASGDQRFVKLSRFMLEGRGIAVGDQSVRDALGGALEDADVDVVLLDAESDLAEGLRAHTAIRAERPELPLVVVAEASGVNPPDTIRVYDKWQETEAAIDAVETAMAGGAVA